MLCIHLDSISATQQFAVKLAKLSNAGDIFILKGELGTGKTTFTKGFAQGLGISSTIKSPTYTLIKEYHEGRLTLYHMDVYRLDEGASDLGLDEYLYGDGICMIEWGQLILNEIDEPYAMLTFQYINEYERKVCLTSQSQALLSRFAEVFEEGGKQL